MREIKFRAWDIQNKNMLEIFNSFTQESWYLPFWKEKWRAMQFTGLYDDTGKEIYEGDLVEIQHKQETKTSYISQVTMTYNGVLVKKHPVHVQIGIGGNRLLSDYCDYGNGGIYHVTCNIVGNIYQNPELDYVV